MNEDSLVTELAQIIANVTDFDGDRLSSHFTEGELRKVAGAIVPTTEYWYRQGREDGSQCERERIIDWLRDEEESRSQSRNMDVRNEGAFFGHIAERLSHT